MNSRPRLSLRSTIAVTISAAVLASTIALGLIGYGVVHMNESGYRIAIQDRQVHFARLSTAYADAVHTEVQSWIDRQASPPTAAMTTRFIGRAFPQSNVANPISVDISEVPRPYPCGIPHTCDPAFGWYPTNSDIEISDGAQYHVVVFALSRTATVFNLRVLTPSASSPPPQGGLALPALAIIVIGTVLALVIGLRVGQSVRRPLRRTALAARRFGSGDHSIRVPVEGSDELADLGHAFNAMAHQLQATLAELHRSQAVQRRFVADVSHELRSPLATMLAAVEGLHGTPDTRERSTALLDTQSRRLAGILEELLEISRFDAGQATLVLEEADVLDIVADAVNTVAPHAPVTVRSRGMTLASSDARRVHTIVRNLVANAVQHGRPPVVVDVDGTDPGWVAIEVGDAGPGIDAERADQIFERFVRGDPARSARGGSSGLGLAIAAENARLHRGTLAVLPGAPTRFLLRLPRTLDGELQHDGHETAT